MDFMESPAFKLIFHEVVCILGILYYLLPTATRLREKKENRPFTTSWASLKNIVALYVAVAEPVFLYEDIRQGMMPQAGLAVASQAAAVLAALAAFLVLREPPSKEKKERGPITKHKWSR